MSTNLKVETRKDVLDVLRSHWAELSTRFGVRRLAVFGSAANDTLTFDSDVDILVGFHAPVTFDRYMDLKFWLEDELGRRVDLVTEKALRPQVASTIVSECVDVA